MLNKIRTLLFTAKLFKKLQTKALMTGVHLYNRTPQQSLNQKSPYKIKYYSKFNLKSLKVWGSITYSKDYTAKKLDLRARPSILVGFRENQYKLIDLNTQRVFYSKDVIVLDQTFLYNQKESRLKEYNVKNFIDLNSDKDIFTELNQPKRKRSILFRGSNIVKHIDTIENNKVPIDIEHNLKRQKINESSSSPILTLTTSNSFSNTEEELATSHSEDEELNSNNLSSQN